jgi:hypothetical protein
MITSADIRSEITRYSLLNGYSASFFAEASCTCGGSTFKLFSDDTEGAAKRVCVTCRLAQLMGDSADYIEGASVAQNICTCDGEWFSLVAGVAAYAGTKDARWYYIGARCTSCQLVGVYADWKCGVGTVEELLARS